MDVAIVIALLGIALLVAELLLSTGGVLAAIGALGIVAGGVVALESDSGAADYVGPALIALGVLSLVAFYFVTRKVIEAHRREPVRTDGDRLHVARTGLDHNAPHAVIAVRRPDRRRSSW